jgi:NADPH-dependent glutamate synthase beta subunit-like oxidoreductase
MYLAEQANRNGWSKLRLPAETTGKNVAVVGAGPAGLSCTAKLLEAGHKVTVFDASTEFGGMISAVIPDDRQSDSLKNEMTAVFSDVPKERMDLRLGKKLDGDFNLDSIINEGFDATFIGMGLSESASVGDKDEDIEGLWNAMDFLSAAKKLDGIDIEGKFVAVIGGGNTAMDVAVTAKQLGAKDVFLIYRRSFKEMPAWSGERARAVKQGVHFMILTQPTGYVSVAGKLTGIKLCVTRLGEPDESGRRRPELIESSTYELDMDVVVEAIGQAPPKDVDRLLPGVEFKSGLIQTEEGSLATSRPGVFAGGDLVRGASTVVSAVADGMAAANEIDEFLRQKV